MLSKSAKLNSFVGFPAHVVNAVFTFAVEDLHDWAVYQRVCKSVRKHLNQPCTLRTAAVRTQTVDLLLASKITFHSINVLDADLDALEQLVAHKAPQELVMTACPQRIIDAHQWKSLRLTYGAFAKELWTSLPCSLTSLHLEMYITNADLAQLHLPNLRELELGSHSAAQEHYTAIPTAFPNLCSLQLAVRGPLHTRVFASLNLHTLVIVNTANRDGDFVLDFAPFTYLRKLSLTHMELPANILEQSLYFLEVLELVRCNVGSDHLKPMDSLPWVWRVVIEGATITDEDLLWPRVTCLELRNCPGVTWTRPDICPGLQHIKLSGCGVRADGLLNGNMLVESGRIVM